MAQPAIRPDLFVGTTIAAYSLGIRIRQEEVVTCRGYVTGSTG
jgi:hypothetical protein